MSTNEQTMAKEEFEAYQRTLRMAFFDGWRAGEEHRRGRTGIATDAEVEAEARKEYPIRKKVPRVVRGINGSFREYTTTVDEEGLWVEVRASGECKHLYDADELRAMVDLLENPYEEINQ